MIMKIILYTSILLVGLLANAQALDAEKSYCRTIPEGSYKKDCTDIKIMKAESKGGVSRCKLTANCKTKATTRHQVVSTTLYFDEGDLGPNSKYKDIRTTEDGHLKGELKGESFSTS
jgi:hypothetical protein